jgi:hypothetical protein
VTADPTDLLDALDAVAIGQTQVARRPTPGGGVEYLRGGRPFAAVEVEEASFLLAPSVAAAALRTPDVTASRRGPGWVTLRPAVLDGHAIDRATAWLESAWRHSVA